jgi:HTH-type transcriptional regulator, transcriptional repressor of NAD biosynthesis genes
MQRNNQRGIVQAGVVLGKFMPLHKGHKYLIDFAWEMCKLQGAPLYVVLSTSPTEPISGAQRYSWMQEEFGNRPRLHIFWLDRDLPQDPTGPDDTLFWDIWENAMNQALSRTDVSETKTLFSSEEYGWKLSEVMGWTHFPVNFSRSVVPISGTKIRVENPYVNWDYLTQAVQASYAKRVYFVGPESVGKTTLSQIIAAKYNTIWVPEFGRDYYEMRKQDASSFKEDDLFEIAAGHEASILAGQRQANKFVMIDTDAIATCLFSQAWFGHVHPLLSKHYVGREFRDNKVVGPLGIRDHIFLMAPTIPFEPDPLRNMPKGRTKFFEDYKTELEKNGFPYHVISSSDIPKNIDFITKILDSSIK